MHKCTSRVTETASEELFGRIFYNKFLMCEVCTTTKINSSVAQESMKTSKTMKLLHTVSRPEFLPANSASLIIGLSWCLTLPVGIVWGLIIPLVLAFAIITLVAAFAAQINTLLDYELDFER
jgi:hypothetical protein